MITIGDRAEVQEKHDMRRREIGAASNPGAGDVRQRDVLRREIPGKMHFCGLRDFWQ
jgi:hypothetical protein